MTQFIKNVLCLQKKNCFSVDVKRKTDQNRNCEAKRNEYKSYTFKVIKDK